MELQTIVQNFRLPNDSPGEKWSRIHAEQAKLWLRTGNYIAKSSRIHVFIRSGETLNDFSSGESDFLNLNQKRKDSCSLETDVANHGPRCPSRSSRELDFLKSDTLLLYSQFTPYFTIL